MGTKLGAGIGWVAGPPGVLVGSVVGAVGGALFGAVTANTIATTFTDELLGK